MHFLAFSFIGELIFGAVICAGGFVFGILFQRRNQKLAANIAATVSKDAAAVKAKL